MGINGEINSSSIGGVPLQTRSVDSKEMVTEHKSYGRNENKEKAFTKTVVITGATSGFGAAMARRFAKAGWRVVATGRRAERLRILVDEFGADTVFPAPFDVRDDAEMNEA